jgi:hypothetical protein
MDLTNVIKKLLNDNWTLEHIFFGTIDNPDPNNKTSWTMTIVEDKNSTYNSCIFAKLQNILNICYPTKGEVDQIDTFSESGGKITIHKDHLDIFLDKLYDFVESRQLDINAS